MSGPIAAGDRFVEFLVAALQAKGQMSLDTAIALLGQAVALAPPEHYCHAILVAWLREAGRPAEACDVLERSVERAPTVAGRFELASLLRDAGEDLRALEHCKAVLVEAPAHAGAQTLVRELDSAITEAASRLEHFLGPLTVEHRYPAPFVQFTGRPRGYHADGNALNGARLDDWGFPNAVMPRLPKPDGETRIFVLGDSTMFNGATLGDTVPGLLEQELVLKGIPNARVYNFAVVSASSMQMVALLFHRLADLGPNLVLVVSGGIDFMNPREYDPRPGYPFNAFMIEELYTSAFDPVRGSSLGMRESFIRRAAAYQLKLRREVGWNTPAWEERVVAAWLQSVEKLAAVALGCNLEIVLLLEPMVAARDQPSVEELTFLRPETREYYQRQYARARAGLRERVPSATPRLTVHDAAAAFVDEPTSMFKDWIHFNDAGRRLITRYMADLVGKRLAARPPA